MANPSCPSSQIISKAITIYTKSMADDTIINKVYKAARV